MLNTTGNCLRPKDGDKADQDELDGLRDPAEREVRAEHESILRAAIREYGGYEIDSQGDSFFAAFA